MQIKKPIACNGETECDSKAELIWANYISYFANYG